MSSRIGPVYERRNLTWALDRRRLAWRPYNRIMQAVLKTLCFISLPLAAAGQVRSVDHSTLPSLLQPGAQVKTFLQDGTTLVGSVIRTSPDSFALATKRPAAERSIAYADIRSISIKRRRGNKRTWLPVALCSTIGTLSFVAAGATEERKGAYLPLAAGVTVALGIGGYYVGQALDREEATYAVKQQTSVGSAPAVQ